MIRASTPSVRVRRPSFRPRCEPLEDRLSPAVHTWTGAVSTLWSNPGNWIGGEPFGDSSATLVFPATPTRFASFNDHSFPPPGGAAAIPIQGITIQGTGYNISGNPINLGPMGITTTNGSSINTFDCDIRPFVSGSFPTVGVTNAGATLNLTGNLRNRPPSIPSGDPGLMGITKVGAGTLALSGNNTYTLGTYLSAGTLAVGSSTALGTGRLTFNGGALQASTSVNLANPFTVAGPNDIEGSQNITFTGPGTLNASVYTSNAAGSTVRFNGPLSGPGGVVAAGPGTVVLANAASSYQGSTHVFGGTLRLAANNAISDTSPTAVWNTGRLDLAGFRQVLGSLGGNGDVTLGSNLYGLSVGTLNTSTSFSGSISGSAPLNKRGAGTWTLAGAVDVTRAQVEAGTLDVRAGLVADSVLVTAGTMRVDASGYIYASGNYVQQAGRTTLDGGGILAALVDLQGGTLSGSGWVYGNLRNDARIDVGGALAAGYLYVLGGNYTQTAGGVLNIELSGPNIVSDYDFLYVEGTAALAGTLGVLRIFAYLPNPGDSFLPIYSGGLTTGAFTTINGLSLGGGRQLWPIYWDNGLILWAT